MRQRRTVEEPAPPRTDRPLRQIVVYLCITYGLTLAIALALPHAGIAPLIEAFDDVYSYNDAIAPQHPSVWQPRVEDLPIWERSLRSLWALEGDLHLVVESIQVSSVTSGMSDWRNNIARSGSRPHAR